MVRAFTLASFYAHVDPCCEVRGPIRQGLVRGLKDYFQAEHGYDRYGAETVLHLEEELDKAKVFGYAALRLVRDRRLPLSTKLAVAQRAIEVAEFAEDNGIPYGLFTFLELLYRYGRLDVTSLRYALVVSAGTYNPFDGTDKGEMLGFYMSLLGDTSLTDLERLMWGHSLLARHQNGAGAIDMIDSLLGHGGFTHDLRMEVCKAWLHFRQPRLPVTLPVSDGSVRSEFVRERFGFWVAHMPSWPGKSMSRQAVVWLARLGDEPLTVARAYLLDASVHAEQVHLGVRDVLSEHAPSLPGTEIRKLIEQALSTLQSVPSRRAFYRLGVELFGDSYLLRASGDTASSVRYWAQRELEKSL